MGSQIQWNQTGRKQELHHQHVRTSWGENFYWRENTEDNDLYVEFKSESDLISATNRYFYYKHIKTFGIPRNYTWDIKTQSPPQSASTSKPHIVNNHSEIRSPATGSNTIHISRSKLNKHVIFNTQDPPSSTHPKVNMPKLNLTNDQHLTLTTSLNVSKESERKDC